MTKGSVQELAHPEESKLAEQLQRCRVEVVQEAAGREDVESRARLVNQPMGSNFDGNCN